MLLKLKAFALGLSESAAPENGNETWIKIMETELIKHEEILS